MAVQQTLVLIVTRLLAVIFGLVWGFFVAFNMVFSDVFGTSEMVGAVVYVFIAYGLLGLAFGALSRATSWKWAFWLAPPGLLLVFLALFDEFGRVAYVASVLAAVIVGSGGGAWLGAKLVEMLAARRHHDAGGGAPA